MEKRERLYLILTTFFCILLVISNFITPKLLDLRGAVVPAGLLTYPLTFLIGDLVTEIYGYSRAKTMIFLGFTMNAAAALIIRGALLLPAADILKQHAFEEVFSQNFIIVFASLAAYILAQLADIKIYSFIKSLTGTKFLWLRSNASTFIAQAVDTTVVISLTFAWGFGFASAEVGSLILFSYLYKIFFNVLMTPFYYLSVSLAKKQLALA